jgi:hypothetical protein
VTSRARAVHLAAPVAVLVSVLTLASPVAPPAAADTCDGVWVVVDARAAGGPLSTRCAPGSPADGLVALQQAGHAYAFVPRIPGMVCTIDARPDPCNGAPVSAYWSYWYAEAGGSWTYATVGAGARTPSPGSVEGWRFGDGSAAPGVAPPSNQPSPPAEPDDDLDEAAGAPATGSSGSTSRSGSGGGGGGSAGSGSHGATAGSPASQPGTAAPDPEGASSAATADHVGAPDEATSPTDDSGGEAGDEEAERAPSWRPEPVGTGEWENPPAADLVSPDPAGEQNEATAAAAETEPTTALATRRSDGDPSSAVGGAVGLGLLAGIGLLTWRQRLRRTGTTS